MKEIATIKTVSMTTVEIAKQTGKAHKHVLTDTRNMLKSLEIDGTVFRLTYKDVQGKIHPCYCLPKREVLILVSGYSIKLRAAIIDKLEELEKGVMAPVKTLTPAEQFLVQAQFNVEAERRQTALEQKVKVIEARQCTDPGYFSITGYANLLNVKVPTQEANQMGRRASVLSKSKGYKIGKVPHERWGSVNSYHEEILDIIFSE